MSKALVNKNLIANSLNQVLGVGFPIVIQYYLIRHLNLDDLGYWNIINSSKTLVLLFIGFFNISMIRCLAKTKDDSVEESGLLTNTILIMYVLLVLPFMVFISYMWFTYPSLWQYILISAISIMTTPLSVEFYFQAKLKNDYLFRRRLIVRTISLIALFGLVRSPENFMTYAWISTLGLSFEHLLNLFFIRKRLTHRVISWSTQKRILSDALPFMPFKLSYNVLPHLSIIIGAYFLSIKEIAVLSILFKLINLATTFITSAVMVLFPAKVMEESGTAQKNFKDQKYLKNTILVSLLIVLGLITFQELIFNIFLADKKIENMDLKFSILCLYIPFHSVYNYLVYNKFLIDQKVNYISTLNVLIIFLFGVLIYLTSLLQLEISFSLSVVIPVVIMSCLLVIKSKVSLIRNTF